MARMVLVFILALVFPLCPLAAGEAHTQSGSTKEFTEIFKCLNEKSGKDLREYLWELYIGMDLSNLTDTQIDTLNEKLLEIAKNDPFQALSQRQGLAEMEYTNRGATRVAIEELQYQKTLNGIRRLPLRERVAALVKKFGHNSSGGYVTELTTCGKDAVPFILQYKPESIEARRDILVALHDIHDPRSIDYIIECLRLDRSVAKADLLHASAAKALASFQDEKVLKALVEALSDPAVRDVTRRMSRGISLRKGLDPDDVTYPAKFYLVQSAASESLSISTGQNWGLLFNEDPVTWRAWLAAKDRKGFDPTRVKRTPEDLKALVRAMFDRYMSGRPSPESYSSINDLAQPEGIAALARDLTTLGSGVVPLIESEVRTRCAADPVWTELLNRWTKKILLLLPWPESLACIGRLEKTYGTIDLHKDMKKTKGRFDNGESA